MNLTTVGPRIAARLFRGFWTRMWWRDVLQSFFPVALLFFTGLSLMFLGSPSGVWNIAHTLGPPVASPGIVILCVAPRLSGLQLLLFAMLLDIQESSPRP